MRRIHQYLLAPFLLALTFQVPQTLADHSQKVFILHSYEKDHVCGRPQSLGVQRALLQAGFGIEHLVLESYAMDSKRINNTPELLEKQAQIALQKITAFKPDILVTLDDNAFRTVALKLVDSEIQIVFSGMNNIPQRYNQQVQWLNDRQTPGHNITGVYEKIHFSTAVKVQQNIQPDMKKLLILSDNSPTGQALVRQVKAEIAQDKLPVDHEFYITDSLEDYRAKIQQANSEDVDTLYPIALRLIDKQGTTHTGAEILAWTGKHSLKPSIPLNFAFVQHGLLGGAGVDFEAMGYQAGQMVVDILNGNSAANIPIEDATRYALVFNLERANSLGINIPKDILLAADVIYPDLSPD